MGQYVQLVIREIEASQRLNARPLRSVFFGGGEPERLLGAQGQACRRRRVAHKQAVFLHPIALKNHLDRSPIPQARPRSSRCRCWSACCKRWTPASAWTRRPRSQ